MENKNVGIGLSTPVAELCVTKNTNIVFEVEKKEARKDENIIFDIVAAGRSKSQKGDLSEFVKDLLSPQQVSTLKKRDKHKMTGNPIDIKNLIK